MREQILLSTFLEDTGMKEHVMKLDYTKTFKRIIVLFILFIVQGLLIAYRAENQFCTMVGIGIMAQIAWQVFCNIAVVTNTIPNTGISLPFFSSGGTSLILLLAEMGVMVNIGRNGERAAQQRAADHARREAERAAQEAERASRTIDLEDARRMRGM